MVTKIKDSKSFEERILCTLKKNRSNNIVSIILLSNTVTVAVSPVMDFYIEGDYLFFNSDEVYDDDFDVWNWIKLENVIGIVSDGSFEYE